MPKTDSTAAVREHLARALDWQEAHVSFDLAIDGIPADQRGASAPGFEHTAWQLVEHLRLAQEDILNFCLDPAYAHTLTWPDDYWPADAAPPSAEAWTESVASYTQARQAIQRLARDVADLTATVPTGTAKQTYLRAILLSLDHAAYHVGQIVAVRRALGSWPVA